MQKLKAAINSLLKAAGLDAGVAQNKALLVWDEVVGVKVSENTTPEKVEVTRQFLNAIDLRLEGGLEPDSSDFAKLLKNAAGREDENIINLFFIAATVVSRIIVGKTYVVMR